MSSFILVDGFRHCIYDGFKYRCRRCLLQLRFYFCEKEIHSDLAFLHYEFIHNVKVESPFLQKMHSTERRVDNST